MLFPMFAMLSHDLVRHHQNVFDATYRTQEELSSLYRSWIKISLYFSHHFNNKFFQIKIFVFFSV